MDVTSLTHCCGVAVLGGLPYGPLDATKQYNPTTFMWETAPYSRDHIDKAIASARAGRHGGSHQYDSYPKGAVLVTTSHGGDYDQTPISGLLVEAGFVMVHSFMNPAHAPFREVRIWILPLTEAQEVVPVVAPVKAPAVAKTKKAKGE